MVFQFTIRGKVQVDAANAHDAERAAQAAVATLVPLHAEEESFGQGWVLNQIDPFGITRCKPRTAK
jgi:hypothetical protein